jgi:hypothetical protein
MSRYLTYHAPPSRFVYDSLQNPCLPLTSGILGKSPHLPRFTMFHILDYPYVICTETPYVPLRRNTQILDICFSTQTSLRQIPFFSFFLNFYKVS